VVGEWGWGWTEHWTGEQNGARGRRAGGAGRAGVTDSDARSVGTSLRPPPPGKTRFDVDIRYGEVSEEEYATSIAGDAQACVGRTGSGPRDGVRGSLGGARAAGSHPS